MNKKRRVRLNIVVWLIIPDALHKLIENADFTALYYLV